MTAPDPYMTATTLRGLQPDVNNSSDFTDATLTALIAEFQGVCENYLGKAYTPRTVTGETIELDHDRYITLKNPNILTVTSVTVTWLGQTTTFASTLYQIDKRGGAIDLLGYYTGEAAVSYTHGTATADIPQEILSACSEYVRARALRGKSSLGRDVIRQGYEGGSSSTYSTPDWSKGRPTGYITVDALLNSQRSGAPGIA